MSADGARAGAGPAGGLADPGRLAAVRRMLAAIGDASSLDRITRLAAVLLDAPHAQASLVAEQHVVVSSYGLPVTGAATSASEALCTVTVQHDRALAVGDARGDDRVAHLPPVTSGAVGAYLGLPLRDRSGHVLGALCVFDPEARRWSAEQVGVLGELAESVVAELELRALTLEASGTATRLDLALDASGIGSFDLDTRTQALHWDDRLVRLFGYDRATFREHLDSFSSRLHPEDAGRVGLAIEQAVRTQGELSVEYRIVRPGGDVRWIEARGRVLPGPGGDAAPRLLGVAYDSTELREARDRLARTLETMNDAFYALDPDWRFTYVNREAERLLRRHRDDLLGKRLWDEFPDTVDTAFSQHYEDAVRTGEPVVFEAPYDPLGGWYEVSVWPGPDGLSVYFREVSARRQAEVERERARAERQQAVVERERAYAEAGAANTRLALLADASTRLAESLEPRQVLVRFGDIVVPALGQWVVVALSAETTATLRGQDAPVDPEQVHVVHLAHAHEDQRPRLAAAVDSLPLSTRDSAGVGAVVRTGRPEWLPEIPAELLEGLAPDERSLSLMRAVDPGSALTVPLVNRGRVLGAVTVAAPAGGPVDRALLADLAGRAAVALDNALLYGAERRTGITLQRSLLPRDLPEVPGLLSAVRYLPGATGAFVGGDWYQGLLVDGRLVLAMGDVMGHGMRSAARMGQLRAIIATLAREGHGPAQLLRRLADGVDVLLDLELATVLVAVYDPVARALTVASAGHPPPLLAPLSGPARFVDVEPGPPLGSIHYPYAEVTVALDPGETLVLYTDGLVENREDALDSGLERLRAAVADLDLPPEQVCDHVLQQLDRTSGGDDDVALLVLSHLPSDGAP